MTDPTPEALEGLRRKLDEIDRHLVETLGERHGVVADVARLKSAGTTTIRDPERDEALDARERFLGEIRDAETALFYFSGHGAQVDGHPAQGDAPRFGQEVTQIHIPEIEAVHGLGHPGGGIGCRRTPFAPLSRRRPDG